MRRRNLTLTLCLLAMLAFSSIGFAAWVITRPSTDHYSEGAIIVDAASNGAYELVVPQDAGNIVFGAPDVAQKNTDWLVNAENKEVLSQTISVAVDIADEDKTLEDIVISDLTISLSYIGKETVDGKIKEVDKSDKFAACVAANLVIAPKLYYYAGLDEETQEEIWVEFESGDTLDDTKCFINGVCVLKIEFAWGSAFDGKNPYTFYNGREYTNDLANEAQDKLNTLHTNLQGVFYKLTING